MKTVVVNFPDGAREFRFPEKPLKDGDVVWHDGQRYRVIHTNLDEEDTTVTVELDSDDIGDLLSSEQGGLMLVPADAPA